MTVQTIVINKEGVKVKPVVRLGGSALGSVWQYAGLVAPPIDDSSSFDVVNDLNKAAQIAAEKLAEKVDGRDVQIELIIDPLIPPTHIAQPKLAELIMTIAENASASVEPGPGSITMRTWWDEKYIGVDAIGHGGCVPNDIRDSLMRPGFTTRIDDWDTGFGLHEAAVLAAQYAAHVEVVERAEGVGFRLAIPLRRGTPLTPPEVVTDVGIPSFNRIFERPETNVWPAPLHFGGTEVKSQNDSCSVIKA